MLFKKSQRINKKYTFFAICQSSWCCDTLDISPRSKIAYGMVQNMNYSKIIKPDRAYKVQCMNRWKHLFIAYLTTLPIEA